ncbi:MAG: DUF1508 domain-containing protein [Bacteroidia bacterium]
MNHDQYLSCKQYENRATANNGFVSFFDEESNAHYFAMIDGDGKVLLKSESYPNAGARDNGIASVTKNCPIKAHYSLKKEELGKYYLSLRAGNHREIARSCSRDTAADTWNLLPYILGEKEGLISLKSLAESGNIEDNYIACPYYSGKAKPAEGSDIATFYDEEIKGYFFYLTDESGEKVNFRSEHYPNAKVRDNGVASVQKNRDLRERYKIIKEGNFYYVGLKAGNHQEITRSCAFASEAEALLLLPTEKIMSNPSIGEDVMIEAPILLAAENPLLTTELPAISEEPEIVAEDLSPALSRSIGKGIETEEVNTEVPLLAAGVVVGAGALSSETKEVEEAALPMIEPAIVETTPIVEPESVIQPPVLAATPTIEPPKSEPLKVEPPIVEVKPVVEPAPVIQPPVLAATPIIEPQKAEPLPQKDKEDDYLACKEYKGHKINDKVNNVALFKHTNGLFYFAIYHKNGKVRLRSEGFKTGRERDIELSGALKCLNNNDYYTTINKGEYELSILKDKTGREVGRSCLEKMGDEPLVAAAPIVTTPKVEEEASDTNPLLVAGALVGGGLLLDGLTDKGGVSSPVIEPLKVETPVVAATPVVESPKVVPPVAEPKLAAASPIAASSSDEGGAGFKLWWLLPLLLLIPLFFWWKGCGSSSVETTATTTATGEAGVITNSATTNTAVTPVPVDTIKADSQKAKTPPPIVEKKTEEDKKMAIAENVRLSSIFFDFDKADLRSISQTQLDKLVKVLNDNNSYTCELRAFTDAKGNDAYNKALSQKRGDNAFVYLKEKGIAENRVKISTFGETNPIAKNALNDGKDTEEGRQLNRRVEIEVFDASGKKVEITDKIAVPKKLK